MGVGVSVEARLFIASFALLCLAMAAAITVAVTEHMINPRPKQQLCKQREETSL